MYINKVRNTITIPMILGIFLLSSIIFINPISAAPVCIPFNGYQLGGTAFDLDEDQNPKGKVIVDTSEVCFDFVNQTLSLYVLVYLYDNDDNYCGYVCISGGGYRQDDGRFYIYGSSTAGTVPGGVAEASGELDGRGLLQDGPNE